MKPEKKRDTVGKLSSELIVKAPDTRSAKELEEAMQQDYLKELTACVQTNRKKYHKDFYVVVLTKNEKLMPNVFRNYFLDRSTCPTPDYDQSVFKFNASQESIEYLWSLPSKDSIEYLKYHKKEVVPEERQLLMFVLDFLDGTLDRLAKTMNGEEANSPLLIH